MENSEVQAHKKRAFWKGFAVCATLVVVVFGYAAYQKISWYSGHTSTSPDEITKIAGVLDLNWDQEIKLERYEFKYDPWWMDKFGSTASAIERTEKSPPWSEMLRNWDRLDRMPSDLVRIRILDWAGDRLDKSAPFYMRQLRIMRASSGKESGVTIGYPMPQLCIAYFDKDDPKKLYVCTEGELMFPDTTIAAGKTSVTMNWSLNPSHTLRAEPN